MGRLSDGLSEIESSTGTRAGGGALGDWVGLDQEVGATNWGGFAKDLVDNGDSADHTARGCEDLENGRGTERGRALRSLGKSDKITDGIASSAGGNSCCGNRVEQVRADLVADRHGLPEARSSTGDSGCDRDATGEASLGSRDDPAVTNTINWPLILICPGRTGLAWLPKVGCARGVLWGARGRGDVGEVGCA